MGIENGAITLDEVCDAIVDCEHKTAPIESFGIPSVRTSNIKNGRIDFASCNRVSENTYTQWTQRREPRAGDLILAREAPVGEVGYIPEGTRACLGQRTVLIAPCRTMIVPRWLLYLLITPDIRHKMISRAEGSTVAHLNMSDIRALEIPIPPPLAEQKKIADILGSLDDKMELNRRMNETLEAMARAIFKSWFVDFDPVRAKLDGRQPPCMDAATAALFPDSFEHVNGELVPKGWELAPLGEQVHAKRGLSYKGAGLSEVGFPLHNLNSILEGGGCKFEGIKHYIGEYKDRHIVCPGDLIVANTEQGHDRLLIGYAAIVPKLFGDKGIYSHHLYRVRPKKASPLTAEFLCHLLNSQRMHDTVSGYANGTTVNMLPQDALERPSILVPPKSLVKRFTDIASPIRERREEFVRENRTLGATRDTLLPKLLSGEIRVADAENIVGKVV